MRLEKKLNLWESQSLISGKQKQQILEFEKNNKKPLFMMGMTLLGIYVMAMGIISIIAANWHDIPAAFKIVSDMLLLSTVVFWTFRATIKNKELWFEGGIIALFMLCGASIGLIGQVFQTNGSFAGWGMMWCLITLPLLAISRRKVLPFLWIALLLASIGSIESLWLLLQVIFNWWIWENHPEAVLVLLLLTGGILSGFFSMLNHVMRPKFQTFKVAVFYAYLMMYGTATGFMLFGYLEESRIFISIYTVLAVFFGIMAFIGDRLKHPQQVNGNIAALYILFLFIYFHLFGNLITTGIGLVLSGSVIIGGLQLTRKIIKKIKAAATETTHAKI